MPFVAGLLSRVSSLIEEGTKWHQKVEGQLRAGTPPMTGDSATGMGNSGLSTSLHLERVRLRRVTGWHVRRFRRGGNLRRC